MVQSVFLLDYNNGTVRSFSMPFFSVLKCPQLKPPANGIVKSPLCPNYSGAQCQVGCLPGYQLVGGSGLVVCQTDNSNNAFWQPSNLQCQGKVKQICLLSSSIV